MRIALSCALSAGLLLATNILESGERTPWLDNYDQARQMARQTGKPIFLVFR